MVKLERSRRKNDNLLTSKHPQIKEIKIEHSSSYSFQTEQASYNEGAKFKTENVNENYPIKQIGETILTESTDDVCTCLLTVKSQSSVG